MSLGVPLGHLSRFNIMANLEYIARVCKNAHSLPAFQSRTKKFLLSREWFWCKARSRLSFYSRHFHDFLCCWFFSIFFLSFHISLCVFVCWVARYEHDLISWWLQPHFPFQAYFLSWQANGEVFVFFLNKCLSQMS